MLGKSSCLKKKKDFQNVFNSGKKVEAGSFYIKVISNNLKESRFGIVVSKKVSKKAVVRNKIKRRTRAIIKANLLKIKKVDCIVFFLSLPTDFNSLKKEIEDSFQKLKIYV